MGIRSASETVHRSVVLSHETRGKASLYRVQSRVCNLVSPSVLVLEKHHRSDSDQITHSSMSPKWDLNKTLSRVTRKVCLLIISTTRNYEYRFFPMCLLFLSHLHRPTRPLKSYTPQPVPPDEICRSEWDTGTRKIIVRGPTQSCDLFCRFLARRHEICVRAQCTQS